MSCGKAAVKALRFESGHESPRCDKHLEQAVLHMLKSDQLFEVVSITIKHCEVTDGE